MDEMEVTSDGWIVTDLETFRLIADNPPQRPYGYLDQLWIDCRSWKPIAVWVIGVGIIALAVVVRWWLLLPLGGALLAWWFLMFRRNVLYLRQSPACVGVVRAMTPHPLSSDYSTGIALMADGREVPVTFPTRLAAGIIGTGEQAEVLFLHDPQSEFSLGVGVRKMTRET